MRSALAYEWVRLRTIRSTYWLIGLCWAFQFIITMIVAWRLPSAGRFSGGENTVANMITLGAASGIAPLLMAYVIGILGVFSMGHEYRHGMIRATLTAVPNRSAAFFAKVITTGMVAAGVALGSIAIGLLSALIFGVGLPTAGQMGRLTLGIVLFTVFFTWTGFAYAAILRNQTAAVALLLLVPSVIESIIRAVVFAVKVGSNDPTSRGGSVQILRLLPYDAGGQMYTRASVDDIFSILGYTPFGPLGGGVVFGVFTAILLAGAYLLFLRRDA